MSMIRATIPLVLCAALTTSALPAVAADPTPAASPGATDEKIEKMKNGLGYVDEVVGKGASPARGKTVSITYDMQASGKTIEKAGPAKPFAFVIGKEQAMKAMEDGVMTMKVGGKRKLIVPPELGYGATGAGSIPPNATLVIEMELIEVK
jgi:FKBP-type peptidyl-prolyl cis-trans isomerase FkpA